MATWHKRKKDGLDLPQCENAHPLDAQLYDLSKLRVQSQVLIRELSGYCHAQEEYDEAAQKFIKTIDEYESSLTNDADPDMILAKKGAQKLHTFLERYHSLLSSTIRKVEEEVLSQFASELETLMEEPKQNRKDLDKAQGVLEVARKKYRDTVASKKTTPAKIHEAQDAQERAKDVFTDAESRTSTSIERSNELVCSECPRLFLTMFRAQERLFRDGLDLLADNRSYYTEFDRTYEAAPDGTVRKRVVEVSAQAQSLDELIKAEKQIALELSVLTDINDQMLAALPQLRISAKDVAGVFPGLGDIVKVHHDIIEMLEAPLGESETVASRVANVISNVLPRLTACYVPFSKAQGEIAFKVKQLRKSKQFLAFLQQFEQNLFQQQQQQQRAALAAAAVSSASLTSSGNGLNIDLTHLISQACRHVHTFKLHVQKVFDTVPSEDEGWSQLHTGLGKLSDLLDRVDDLLVETEHTKQLLRVKAKIPALDEAISDNPARVFLFDSDVAVATTQGFKDFIPVSAENPNATSSSAKKRNMIWLPNHLFLFNDYLVATERDDSAAPAVPVLPSLQQNLILDEDDSAKHKDKDNAKWRVIGFYSVYDLMVENAPENEINSLSANRSLSSSSLASPDTPKRLSMSGSSSSKNVLENRYSYFRVRCGDKCSTISVGSVSHQAMWLRVLSSAISERRRNQVFGVPISDIMSRETEAGRDIPNVVEDMISAVETPEWLKVEGIYRICSSVSDVLRLQGRMDAGKRVQFTDAHSSANALKLWIRELPEPLLGNAYYDEWWHVTDVETARTLIGTMPPSHVPVLAALLKHIMNVAKYEEYNKMGINNLSILFTPSILRQPTALNELIRPAGDRSPLPFLIDHFDEIFTGQFTPMTTRPRMNSLAVRANANQSEQLKQKLSRMRSRKNESVRQKTSLRVKTENASSPLSQASPEFVVPRKNSDDTSKADTDSSSKSRKSSDASEGSEKTSETTKRRKRRKGSSSSEEVGEIHQHEHDHEHRKKKKKTSHPEHEESPEKPQEEQSKEEDKPKEEKEKPLEEVAEQPKAEEVKHEEEPKEEQKQEQEEKEEPKTEEQPKEQTTQQASSKPLPQPAGQPKKKEGTKEEPEEPKEVLEEEKEPQEEPKRAEEPKEESAKEVSPKPLPHPTQPKRATWNASKPHAKTEAKPEEPNEQPKKEEPEKVEEENGKEEDLPPKPVNRPARPPIPAKASPAPAKSTPQRRPRPLSKPLPTPGVKPGVDSPSKPLPSPVNNDPDDKPPALLPVPSTQKAKPPETATPTRPVKADPAHRKMHSVATSTPQQSKKKADEEDTSAPSSSCSTPTKPKVASTPSSPPVSPKPPVTSKWKAASVTGMK